MGGWVERKQLVKTELLLKGGRVWGARDGEGERGRQKDNILRYPCCASIIQPSHKGLAHMTRFLLIHA